jgi:hypothetical protein
MGMGFVCVAVVPLVIVVVGCGDSAPTAGSAVAAGSGRTSGPALTDAAQARDADGDNDSHGMGPSDNDGDATLTFGPAASASERQAIISLLRRYYAAAAAGDGESACALTYWLVSEKIVEEHHHGKGARSLRGNTCAEVASKLFQRRHRELVEDLARFNVGAIQVHAKHGWVVLDFGTARERVTQVHREPGGWKMDALPDSGAL